MSESFAELFEASLKDLDVARGSIIRGTVVAIDSDWITVNAGLKSEGIIAREEFLNEAQDIMVLIQAQSPAFLNSNIYFDDIKIAFIATDGTTRYLADCAAVEGIK